MTTPSRRSVRRQPSSPLTPCSPLPSSASLCPGGEDTFELDSHTVMHTPRKGRRMAGVQMGWETPSRTLHTRHTDDSDQWSHIISGPATIPRASKHAALSSSSASCSSAQKPGRAIQRQIDGGDWTSKPAAASSMSVTPRKRRAANQDDTQHDSPSRLKGSRSHANAMASLVDSQGFASAAALASATPKSDNEEALLCPSPSFNAPPPAQPQCDPLALFKASDDSHPGHVRQIGNDALPSTLAQTCRLVVVEVKGMGRIAVDRDMAVRLGAFTEEQLRASQDGSNPASSSSGSRANSSNDGQSTSSMLSASTNPTSLDTPAAYSSFSGRTSCLDPSPSFSLASHFPASEQGSPSMRASKHSSAAQKKYASSGLDPAVHDRVQLFKDKLLASSSKTHMPTAPLTEGSLRVTTGQARLGGSSAAFDQIHTLPTLDWPDHPSGPWSSTTTHLQSQRDGRIDIVARWLDLALDDDESLATAADADAEDALRVRSKRQQHPMISKALRDRRRKEAAERLALSASMPNLRQTANATPRRALRTAVTPKRRTGRTSKSSRRRGVAGALKDHHTPSSAGLSATTMSAGSLIGCHCGTEEEGMMVQCDGCHLWYHSRCVGIHDPDTELEDTWFCQPCEGQGRTAQPRTARHQGGTIAFSPASTVALSRRGYDAPSTAGSMATATPSLLSTHGGLPAFPRTYGSHIGVGTPSAPYLRHRNGSQDHHLPVFAQTESPMDPLGRSYTGLAFSSALALAPSPQMDGGAETLGSAMKKQAGQGRTRAARIGWQPTEPSSPLDRKSSAVLGTSRHARFRTPSYVNKHQMSNARGHADNEDDGGAQHHRHMQQHVRGGDVAHSATMSPSFFSNLRNASRQSVSRHDRTPSPSRRTSGAVGQHIFSTPSRQIHGGHHSVHEDGEAREVDDVFSTPSRHLPGSSWWGGKMPASGVSNSSTVGGEPSSAASHVGATPSTPHSLNTGTMSGFQTPSRSTRRRESSGWGLGLATPGSGRDRDMLFGGGYQSTDVSGSGYSTGGVPSLVFSSGGGIDAVLDDFPTAHWGNASPSRIASARRRQRSGVDPLSVGGGRSLGSRPSTSSLRSSATRHRTSSGRGEKVHFDDERVYDEDDDNLGLDTENEQDPPTSSSPYPRTPSMDLGYGSANRLMGVRHGQGSVSGSGARSGGGASGRPPSTPGSPTPTRGRLASLGSRKSLTAGGFAPLDGFSKHGGNGSPKHSTTTRGGHNRSSSPGSMGLHHAQHDPATHFGLGLDLDDVLNFF